MNCERCGREIEKNENIYSAVGVYICEDCNNKKSSISMDEILDKIIKKENEKNK